MVESEELWLAREGELGITRGQLAIQRRVGGKIDMDGG